MQEPNGCNLLLLSSLTFDFIRDFMRYSNGFILSVRTEMNKTLNET